MNTISQNPSAYASVDDTMFVLIFMAVFIMLSYFIYWNFSLMVKGLFHRDNNFGKFLFVTTRIVILLILGILLLYDARYLLDVLMNAKIN